MYEKPPRVTVHPPGPGGARRVTVDGRPLGVAHRIEDLVKFLRHARLTEHVPLDEVEVEETDLIDWLGGGPEEWGG
ncbi:hypothetical protein [Streptomyces halobius]|uniref:Uncharacterized protein n=1 Tax=Streptomyces halobius TaxID=2879846 RepID=A0ABY4MB78_9ACTN|nr:hypothetical protein [Streptomyces halobius]UQA95030.1 hypothetical protein K9S39_27075 [Streptomyces halobius]